MKDQKTPLQEWKYHLIFWHLYVAIAFFSFEHTQKTKELLFLAIDIYTHNLLVIGLGVYFQAYLLFLFRKKIRFQVLISIANFFLYYFLREALNYTLVENSIMPTNGFSETVILDAIVIWFFFSGTGTALYLSISTIEKQARIIILEKEKSEKDKMILEEKRRNALLIIESQRAELAKLKAQINPHFLFNTLNFFYSEVRPLHAKTAESIMLLSDILRYSLIENQDNDLVDLNGELTYVKDYIELQRNRFYDNFYLTLTINKEEEVRNKKIPSMVLLTLIENCFKYGNINDPDTPCLITINITPEHFIYNSSNKIQTNTSQVASMGLGMNNIKNRLMLIYGENKFIFETKTIANNYYCNLTLSFS